MRLPSITGAIRGGLHLAAFGALYAHYLSHVGEWFADLGVVLIATPFIWTMRQFSGGSYDFSGDATARVVAAAAFGTLCAYALGVALEAVVRLAIRTIRSKKPA